MHHITYVMFILTCMCVYVCIYIYIYKLCTICSTFDITEIGPRQKGKAHCGQAAVGVPSYRCL